MDRDDPGIEGILISGHDPVWLVRLCLFLGLAGLVFCVLLSLQRPNTPVILPFVVLGGGLTIAGFSLALVLRQRRRYLLPTDDGFIYSTAQGERTFHDDDVMCVSLSSQENYFWGNLKTVTRRFIIWIETSGLPERIVCISHLKPTSVDLLQRFVVRIINGLHNAARDAWQHGERVEGDGWALERGQLLVKTPRSTIVISIDELQAVDIVDQHINIWRRGFDLPIARIPVRTANAHLLLLMLNELLPAHAGETEANLPAGQLGRVIFERRPGSRFAEILGWLVVSLITLLMLVAIVRAVFEPRPRRRTRMVVMSLVLGGFAATGSSLLSLKRRTRFRRHALGIYQRGMFSERRLRFSEIANMSYVAVRRYSHGIYNGTLLTIRFTPMPGAGLKPVYYSANIQHADAELDKLRDDVSEHIAERMQDFWQRNGSCPWIPFLTFQREGLDYRPLTFTGRKSAVHIPLSQIVNFSIIDGTFHVWLEGQRKPTISEETSQPNFYPGLTFFSRLLNRPLAAEQTIEAMEE